MKYSQENWSKELDKYQSGNHSDEERYKLEKAGLDDPFLFDSLEGYSLYANATSDRSKAPGSAKSGATIFSMRNLAVAASLALLVSVVGYMQYTNGRSTPNPIVSTHSDQEEDKTIAMVAEQEDAGVVSDQEDFNQTTTITKAKVVEDKEVSSLSPNKSVESVDQPKIHVPETQEQLAERIKSFEQQSPKVTLKQNSKKQTLSTREIAADGASIGNSTAKESNIENESQFSTKLNQKSKTLNKIAAPSSDESVASVFKTKVTPPKGWEAFGNNIEKKKQNVKVLKPVKVYVTFTVKPDGTLSGVKANLTDCRECDDLAEKLIRESGKWKNLTGKPEYMAYMIKF